jgi:dolichyl-phosphate beta-glucosyltransferase
MYSIAVIMPAYNEAGRIRQTINSVARYQRTNPNIRNVILADDGSVDDTAAIARDEAERAGLDLEVLAYPHRGKAATVRAAMIDSAPRVTTDYLMMLDADDELKIDQLDRVPWSPDQRTIYIGRRVGTIGEESGARPSALRRSMSMAMRLASRTLLGIRFPDTQCGFKLFPRGVVPELFGQQRSTSWTFDAELLYIAQRVSQLPIVEIPVVWSPRGVSRVRPIPAALSGLSMFGTAVNRVRRVYHPVETKPRGEPGRALINP